MHDLLTNHTYPVPLLALVPSQVATCSSSTTMPWPISLPSRSNTLAAPSEAAASATSTTTPLISAAQGSVSTSITATSPAGHLPSLPRLVLPAESVARPVSRWLGPLRKRYPQHHLYRGVKYWQNGFEEIQFIVDNFVDWRDKPEVISLVNECVL